MTQSWNSHTIISAISFWLHRPVLANVGVLLHTMVVSRILKQPLRTSTPWCASPVKSHPLAGDWSRHNVFQGMAKAHEVMYYFSHCFVFLFSSPKALSSIALEHFKRFSSNPIFNQSILSVICHTYTYTYTHTCTHTKKSVLMIHVHQTELDFLFCRHREGE